MKMQSLLESALHALCDLLTFFRSAKTGLSTHRPMLRQCRPIFGAA
jgi:hypothetical protein